MIYEDLRPIEYTKGLICCEDIYSIDSIKLTSKGTIITDSIIKKLQICSIDRIRVWKEIDTPYTDEQSVDNDLVNSVSTIIHDVLKGNGIPTQQRDKLFNVLCFCNIENFESLVSYIHHIETNDGFTYNHSIISAWIAVKVGRLLSLNDSELKILMQIGLLHDIGKSCIPSNILNKPSKLSYSEFELVKRHPLLGYHMLRSLVDDTISYAILCHHEKLNGTGYPNGIKGNQIPIYSQIISVVDVFEALIAFRPYKDSMTPISALKIIREMTFRGEIDFSIYALMEMSIMNSYIGDTAPDDPQSIIIGYDKGNLQLIYSKK